MCTRAVSGLAHYLEREGLPTTVIALIRPHAAQLRPPRALAVPFELGRPFGAPEAPDFQRRVLLEALSLLERTDGPILVDFADAPPEPGSGLASWSAPIEAEEIAGDFSDPRVRTDAIKSEITALRPMRDQFVLEHGGRQFDRITPLTLDQIIDLIQGFILDPSIENPMPAFALRQTVKFATDDLKHFYYQAGLAGAGRITDIELDNWFFGNTLAGDLVLRLKAGFLSSSDAEMRLFAERSLVPSHQAHRVPRANWAV
jgi:hypothetical protein